MKPSDFLGICEPVHMDLSSMTRPLAMSISGQSLFHLLKPRRMLPLISLVLSYRPLANYTYFRRGRQPHISLVFSTRTISFYTTQRARETKTEAHTLVHFFFLTGFTFQSSSTFFGTTLKLSLIIASFNRLLKRSVIPFASTCLTP